MKRKEMINYPGESINNILTTNQSYKSQSISSKMLKPHVNSKFWHWQLVFVLQQEY